MIRYQMKAKANTEQLNLRPPSKLVNKLSQLAREFKGEEFKRTEIAVEVLTEYIDLWEALARKHRADLTAQKAMILNSGSDLPLADATQDRPRRRRVG